LDSLHLAAALELGDELEGIVTYDRRLAAGAQALGIHVVAPM
jgi:predicted nucleic acid-binding protein